MFDKDGSGQLSFEEIKEIFGSALEESKFSLKIRKIRKIPKI